MSMDLSGILLLVIFFLPLSTCVSDYCSFQPFTSSFPRADINELLSPDLLHQLIKGAFKDHLVTWVNDYIKTEYPASEAQKILNDIDQR
jgi:Plavaka transposase